MYVFNKAIIDATAPYCVAYKPNVAFYEAMGQKGWLAFEKRWPTSNSVIPISLLLPMPNEAISGTPPKCMRFYFEVMKVDAVTVSPYGRRWCKTFSFYPQNHVILLALTSTRRSRFSTYGRSQRRTAVRRSASHFQNGLRKNK